MTTLKIKRVLGVPQEYDASTLYIVKASASDLVELYFSDEAGEELRRVLTEDDVEALLTTATVAAAGKLSTARNINGVPFDGTAGITINAVDLTARIAVSEKGAANGVATLDGDSLVPVAQIPSRFDNVVEADNLASLPAVGSDLKIYIAINTNTIYRWDVEGAEYVSIGGGGALEDTITPGEYVVATYNSKGQATEGRALLASDVPSLPGSKINSALSVDTTGNAATASSATKLTTARTINGTAFDGTANITINAVDATARIASTEKGAANGVATLDGSGLVPSSQLPSYVDDVIEAENLAAFPVTGETGKIYVALDTNKTYRWSGSVYVQVGANALTSDEALKLHTAHTINLGGDGTWSVNFDGSTDVTANLVLATVATAQSNAFVKLTFNAKGLVTGSSAVGASDITTALGFTPVDKAGDTMTGDLTIAKASPAVVLNATANTTALTKFSSAGAVRWTVGKDSVTEAGSGVGSNFVLSRFDDSGTVVDKPIFLDRSTGYVGIGLGAAPERVSIGETSNSVNSVVGLRTKNASGALTRATVTQEALTGSLRVKVDVDGHGTEGALILENNSGEVARANAAKQIMIGATSPTDGALLTVNGQVSVGTGTASTHAVNKAQVAAMFDEILHPFMFLGVANAQ